MDDKEEGENESRSSTAPNTRRRIVTKTPLEENKGDERTVALTFQESLDGIREKAMRTASLDGVGASSSAGRCSSSGGADDARNKKVDEIVRPLVGLITQDGDIVVASDSKSKLWKGMSLKWAIHNWNVKYVDVARSPGSALRVFTSSGRLANQLKNNNIGKGGRLVKKTEMGDSKVGKVGEVGKLVKKIEMGDPKIGKSVQKTEMGDSKVGKVGEVGKWVRKIERVVHKQGKMMMKVETGGMKVEELVKRIQMNEPKVGKVKRWVRFGQEEYTKLGPDAMLAEADEEDELIKCFDDITGKELLWQAVKQAPEKELKHLHELGFFKKRSMSAQLWQSTTSRQ